MNRKMLRGSLEPSGDDVKTRWAKLIEDDLTGIDADIERILGAYQSKYQTTRDKANAELVRRLSSLGWADAPPMENGRLAEPYGAWHATCL